MISELKVCLFPGYIGIQHVKHGSPKLYKFFARRQIKLVGLRWDGTIGSVPSSKEKVLVRCSSIIDVACSRSELEEICAERGHFLFYEDVVYFPDRAPSHKILEELEKFMDRL